MGHLYYSAHRLKLKFVEMTGSAIVFFPIFELLVFYRLLEEHGRISDRLHVHDGNVEFHLVHFFPRALFTGDLRQLPA